MDRVCPLLGLQGDGRTAIDGVDPAHRCHADVTPIGLDRQQQAGVCLTSAHEQCDRYLAHAARVGGFQSPRSTRIDGLVSTRMILAPEPAWRGIAGRARRAPAGPLLAVGAAGLALGIGGVAVASGAVGDAINGLADATPAPTPAIAPTQTETATPTQSAVATPSPTPTPTPSPTPTPVPPADPTVAPTLAPTQPPQQTYTVQENDTLAAIAQRFGTSVETLQAANNIEDPDEIIIGQVLVIP